MVSLNLGGDDNAEVHNVLNNDETEWLAEEGRTEEQGFVLRSRACKAKIIGLKIKNAAKPYATKGFKVSGALEYGQWESLAEGDLEEIASLVTFYFDQPLLVGYIRFELLSYHGGKGGGLRSFSLMTGDTRNPIFSKVDSAF